ncbi:MAG: protoglobin domain-containing protein [Candidatus Thiodiazotropha sp. L084R]
MEQNRDIENSKHEVDFSELMIYAKRFTGLTQQRESLLMESTLEIKPALPSITERFYTTLQGIDQTALYLEGRVDKLKKTHLFWLEGLFTGPFDKHYVQSMYQVGRVHVDVDLPVEFMSGGMSLIGDEITNAIFDIYSDRTNQCQQLLKAVNSVMSFSLLIMQQSYQNSSLVAELDRFLAITGMSRKLFDNLASAYHK